MCVLNVCVYFVLYLHNILWRDLSQPNEEPITFWRGAMAEVCVHFELMNNLPDFV